MVGNKQLYASWYEQINRLSRNIIKQKQINHSYQYHQDRQKEDQARPLNFTQMQQLQQNPEPIYTLCQNNNWCTYEAVDYVSINILNIVLAVYILGLAFVIRNFMRLLKIRSSQQKKTLFGPIFLRVYYIVFAWFLFSIVKITMNIYAYYAYICVDVFQQPSSDSPIVIISAIFNAFDMSCTFCVLSLIILIPYQWFKFLLQHINEQQHIPLHCRIMYSRSFNLLKFIKIYMLARVVILVSYFVQAGFILHTDFGCRLPNFDIIIIIAESVFILGIYLAIFYVAEVTKRLKLVKMKLEDYKKIRLEYSLLIVALLARIFLNGFFNGLAEQFLKYEPRENCSDANLDSYNNMKRSIFLGLGYSIMHFLPIGLVVYIYKPNIEEREKDQAILKYDGSQKSQIEQRSETLVNITESADSTDYKRLD